MLGMVTTPMTLREWQKRIERHFECLARRRAGSGHSIFALEHDLNSEELNELSSLIRSQSRFGILQYWILWVIYATEQGYSYAGDEYWGSFEEQTPQWEYRDRYELVPCFRRFQEAYEGVVPAGPWANHFRIIAWPITHSILPRYLQRNLAKALYDLRFRLAYLETHDPTEIGRLLSANAQHTSLRFQEFLQQEDLVGRIVLSLLDARPSEGNGSSPIYQPTLQRIVRDMEEIRSAGTWLKEAQRIVTDRFVGIGRGSRPRVELLRPRPPSSGSAPFGIRPSVLLGHRGAGTWSVRMELRSFRYVATLSADICAFLKRTRCRLNGADDVKPAGWLLSGNRKGILKSWPDLTRPLIQFDGSHGVIENLLETECRLSSGPVWLFRVAGDGTAREIIGGIVRPGYCYIVLTTGELPNPHAGISECSIDCTGIRSFRLLIPSEVSASDTAWLKQLGLQVARTIRVWPAGLPGRNWDGEGNSDWLTTEAPCFGMTHDHPIDAYELRIDNGAETVIAAAGEVGCPVFVRIPPLTAGKHLLTVKARRSASLNSVVQTPAAEGFTQLHVREPEVWTPELVSHPGLTVSLDPEDADLDTFWRNEVSLSVLGPESHSVTLSVSLEGTGSQMLLSEQVGGLMRLPVKPDAWRSRFKQFLNHHEKYVWAYLEAVSGKLLIKGEELGEWSFQFEHNTVPVRWVLCRDHGRIIVRLIDDTGQESDPEVQFFDMNRPLRAKEMTAQKALAGIVVHEPPGGLFVAKHPVRTDGHDSILLKPYSDAVIVSVMVPSGDFKSLSAKPAFPELSDGSVTLADSLRLLTLWQDARRSGFVVNVRHEQVINAYVHAIYVRLCGERWARVEDGFRRNPSSRDSVEALQRSVERSGRTRSNYAASLQRDYSKMDGDMAEASQWYADLAKRYGICTSKELCDFALRLASQPYRLFSIYGATLDRLLHQIAENPVTLRGARLLAVLSANKESDRSVRMLPRWKW